MRIVLASASKQRQDILDMIGLNYEIVTSDIEEVSKQENPSKYVEELALNKAKNVSLKVNGRAIVVAADTIIYADGKKYEKPKTKKEAFDTMKKLSEKMSFAYTGISVRDLYQNKTITTSDKAEVYFRKMTDEEIAWYVDNEEKVFKCAGYVTLGKGAVFLDKIVGDYNTLFGLSPSILFKMFKELGYSIDDIFKEDNNFVEMESSKYLIKK